MEKLNHETGESLECSRYADSRADFDEDTFGSMYVYLEFTSFIDRRIKKGEQALFERKPELLRVCQVHNDIPDG